MAITRWTPQSSAIRRTIYSAGSKTLAVQYKSGAVYTYKGITPQRFAALRKASSAGAFVNKSVKAASKGAKVDITRKGALRRSLIGVRSSRAGSSTSGS